MTEYIPCVLKRGVDPTKLNLRVTSSGPGYVNYTKENVYKEELIPVEMDEFVQLAQGKRTLLPGPWRLCQVPEWASKWFGGK